MFRFVLGTPFIQQVIDWLIDWLNWCIDFFFNEFKIAVKTKKEIEFTKYYYIRIKYIENWLDRIP